ncbi:hypothetical protein DXT96_06855 [Agrobacterium sp. ICMP 6402]|uniref:hypothetical protein n=1 Tax=Agrobacterium sp. ICMP 6402 TaxID=2292443 RepID=UPI001297F531|nr:hypothetical protein [Agrobacterium sp. ICMP 6402]MQB09574.1 hypothetical protein [Agrobacterium sp. ICMP 6402]
MTKRITDLEKFALEQVWRPYQNQDGFAFAQEDRFEALPISLEETAKLLISDESGWSKCVLDRISAIGFTFPSYIYHPLVDVVRTAREVRKGTKP